MADLFERISDVLVRQVQTPAAHGFKKSRVELVLGTDRAIGRKHDRKGLGGSTQERRVGIIPTQVTKLKKLFQRLGLDLSVLVLERAGARAGYSDSDYVHAGAEIVGQDELVWHDGPPDVVHALKEPSPYEADLPGPFLRIGALHAGDFQPDGGFAKLLSKGNVSIFDGSNIGAPGNFRVPIRASMSLFAGEIAADWALEHCESRQLTGRIVVVGGGNAGRSCVRRLLDRGRFSGISIVESTDPPERAEAVKRVFAGSPSIRVLRTSGLDDPAVLPELEGAHGIVFAVAAPGGRAPRIVSSEALGKLHRDAIIIDISIDERGAILDSRLDPNLPSDDLILHFEKALQPRRYRAVVNMPRAYPNEASAKHGEVVLPYLAMLLYLAAREGGAAGATRFLQSVPLDRTRTGPESVQDGELTAALMGDLRNGMAVFPRAGGVVLASIIPEEDRAKMTELLKKADRPVTVE